MEYEIKTIVCPNCGANTTNHQNCEYCGSMLVRCYEMMDCNEDGIDELLNDIRSQAYVSPLLCERVGKTDRHSKKHKAEVWTEFEFYYCSKWHRHVRVIMNPQSKMAELVFMFDMENEYEERKYHRLIERQLSKLLKVEQDGTLMIFTMEIDKNERSIALFIKYFANRILLEEGDNRISWRTFGTIEGKSFEFVPQETVSAIEVIRRSNMIKIIAGIFGSLPLIIVLFSDFENGFERFIFIILAGGLSLGIWCYMLDSYINTYEEKLRNRSIHYNVNDKSIISD